MSDEQVADVPILAGEAPSGDDWKEALPEDLRSHDALASIKDVGNLAKSYVHAQSMIGRDKIAIPGKHSSPEDWDDVYTRLGKPDEAAGYDVNFADDADKGLTEWFKATAHKAGLNNAQATLLAKDYDEFIQSPAAAQEPDYGALQSAARETLRKEYGQKFDENMGLAKSVLAKFGSDAMSEVMLADGSRLGDNPDFIRAFVNAGEFIRSSISEDAFEGMSKPQGGMTPAEVDDQLLELERAGSPLYDATHPQHRTYVDRRTNLYNAKFDTE